MIQMSQRIYIVTLTLNYLLAATIVSATPLMENITTTGTLPNSSKSKISYCIRPSASKSIGYDFSKITETSLRMDGNYFDVSNLQCASGYEGNNPTVTTCKLNRKLVEAKTVKVDYEVKYRGKDSSSVTNSMGAPGYKRVIINRVVTITGISDITLEISEVETKKIGKHSNTNNGDNMTSAWSNEDRLDVATKNLPAIYTSVVFVLPILMTLATILFY
jgi:hypothetical protein